LFADSDRLAALRAGDFTRLGQSREDHVLEGLAVAERVPGARLEHAVGDLVRARFGRGDESARAAVTKQFDLHEGPPRSAWVHFIGLSQSKRDAGPIELTLTFCD